MLVEVSAKREASPEFFHTQATQGFAHGEEKWDESPDGPVYVLLINGGSIESSPKLREVYDAAAKVPRTGDIRLLPINGIEFAQLVRHLADPLMGQASTSTARHSRRPWTTYGSEPSLAATGTSLVG